MLKRPAVKVAALWSMLMLVACGGAGSPSAAPGDTTGRAAVQAQDLQAVTAQSTALTAGLITEPPSSNASYTLVEAPAHGTVTFNPADASFTYTPADGYSGADHFRSRAQVNGLPSAAATASIEVLSTATAASPRLATACNALNSAFAPLCAQIDTLTAPLVAGCSAAAPAEFCAVFGGDLYTLAQGCFTALSGQSATLCKGVATALQAAASQCRAAGAPADFCALFSGTVIADGAVADYQNTPVHRALQQQWLLGATLPLRAALVPATHNAYNYSNASMPSSLSGLDPDQFFSFTQQLNLDMRGLELDVHWFPSVRTGSYAPLLCHAESNHIGCTIERTLEDGLREIRAWLDQHPDQVIVLDVEQHLDDQVDDASQSFPAAAAVIESTLGATSARDLILRPGQPGAVGRCADHPIPLDLSLAQIRAAGKQVLIYSSGCGQNAGWDAIVHDQRNRLQGPSTDFGDSQFPDCHFSRDEYQQSWTRFYDSSTFVDAVSGSGTALPFSPSQIHQMVRCGVDMPSINFLDPHTAQLRSFVWSWDYGQPLASNLPRCAVHNGAGYFQAEACAQLLRYACADGDHWQITPARGLFEDGDAACAAAFPGSHFAVPRSGYQNELLKAAKGNDVTRVWLNLTKAAGGADWHAAPTP